MGTIRSQKSSGIPSSHIHMYSMDFNGIPMTVAKCAGLSMRLGPLEFLVGYKYSHIHGHLVQAYIVTYLAC